MNSLTEQVAHLVVQLNASTSKYEVHMREQKVLFDENEENHIELLREKQAELTMLSTKHDSIVHDLNTNLNLTKQDADDHHMELDKYRSRVLELEGVEETLHVQLDEVNNELHVRNEEYYTLQSQLNTLTSNAHTNSEKDKDTAVELSAAIALAVDAKEVEMGNLVASKEVELSTMKGTYQTQIDTLQASVEQLVTTLQASVTTNDNEINEIESSHAIVVVELKAEISNLNEVSYVCYCEIMK